MRSLHRALIAAAVLVFAPASAVSAAGVASPSNAAEKISTSADQRAVALTIYNGDLALIRDERHVRLEAGFNRLAFRDVSGQMTPETALLRSLVGGADISIIEQNFNFDILNGGNLLAKSVGQKVYVYRMNPTTGKDIREEATVLSAADGGILQYADRIEAGVPPYGRIVYGGVPSSLRERPTLVVDFNNAGTTEQEVELSYLTGGLSWHADYVGLLNGDNSRMELNGLITLTNSSGASYQNALLQLVAGNVNQPPSARVLGSTAIRAASNAYAAPTEQTLFEYHLYTMPRPTTIANQQTKQLALLHARNIAVTESLELRGDGGYYNQSSGDLGENLKLGAYIEFVNEGGDLGIPLPAGTVRLYKKDNAGRPQFIGADTIDHTPRKEKVRLYVGESFDVTAHRVQTNFTVLGSDGRGRYQYKSSYRVELKNAKSVPVTVKVVEQVPGDWQIVAESNPHVKPSSATAVWSIRVPPGGQSTLTYTALVTE
jgi:hypothetical protein